MTSDVAQKSFFLFDERGTKTNTLKLGARIAGGAAGDIYPVDGSTDHVVKIFRDTNNRNLYEPKVQEMLVNSPKLPPIFNSGDSYHQLSWPNGICRDKNGNFFGYRMPKIHLDKSVNLERLMQKRMRKLASLPEFFGYRINCAANLSGVISALHEASHCVVDLKPANIQVYRETMYVTVLDCDGFRISGSNGVIFPAHQFTPEYIAPEATKKRPESLDFEQDYFALAVIIFRLLNNGIHPFQAGNTRKQFTIQEMVQRRRYAYGEKIPTSIIPSQMSIHSSFPIELRTLFEQAFTNRKRPSAQVWHKLLSNYGDPNNGILKQCEHDPDHAHFGLGCGFCAIELPKQPNLSNRSSSGAPIVRQKAARGTLGASVRSLKKSPCLNVAQNRPATSVFTGPLPVSMGTTSLSNDPDIFDLDKVSPSTRLDTVNIDKIFLSPGGELVYETWRNWPVRKNSVLVWLLRVLDAGWILLIFLAIVSQK